MEIRELAKSLSELDEFYGNGLEIFNQLINKMKVEGETMGQLVKDPSFYTREHRAVLTAISNSVNGRNPGDVYKTLKRFNELTSEDPIREPAVIALSTFYGFGEAGAPHQLYAVNIPALVEATGSTEVVEALARLVGGMFVPLEPIGTKENATALDAVKEASKLIQKYLEIVDDGKSDKKGDKEIAPLTAEMMKTELVSVMVACASLVLKELKGK